MDDELPKEHETCEILARLAVFKTSGNLKRKQ